VDVNYNAVDGGPDDPCHSFDCITQQIYGFKKRMDDKKAPVTMSGFVANAIAEHGRYDFVMSAFNSSNLPVLSALATEYAVFDHWHCSCPCPTNPNREFLMSGTSHGMTENTIPKEGFPQETHFAFLERHNITWKIYYNDDPWMAPTFADLRVPSRLRLVQEMPNFFGDLKNGTLPQYVLIQPRMATSHTGPSNWQVRVYAWYIHTYIYICI
jgi:phospholipase C